MDFLIWIGAAVTLAGVGILMWCVARVSRARGEGLPDEELKARLQGIVAWNLGALFLSAIGLMLVIVGIIFS